MIIIKDIEMPKTCTQCPLSEIRGSENDWGCDDDYCICKLKSSLVYEYNQWNRERHRNCPLLEAEDNTPTINQWTPVKSKKDLPLGERVFITDIFNEVEIAMPLIDDDRNRKIANEDDTIIWRGDDGITCHFEDILAWMPLPGSYTQDKSEEK